MLVTHIRIYNTLISPLSGLCVLSSMATWWVLLCTALLTRSSTPTAFSSEVTKGDTYDLVEYSNVIHIWSTGHFLSSWFVQFRPTLSCVLVCPKLVKAALSLVLFGGRQKHTDKNSVPVRGDPHLLMVGDPGLGKSQMLQVTQETLWIEQYGRD